MNRVTHFDIQADNVERAKKFYERAFGWKIKQVMKKSEGGMDYWLIDTGTGNGINGGMSKRPEEEKNRYWTYSCVVEVQDIDKAIKDVKSNGGSIEMEKMELKGVGFFANVKDTEGNRFGLMQPTAPMKQ